MTFFFCWLSFMVALLSDSNKSGFLVLLSFVALMSSCSDSKAGEVYRCGNKYQDSPAPGCSAININPDTNVIQHYRVPIEHYDLPTYAPPTYIPTTVTRPLPEAPSPNQTPTNVVVSGSVILIPYDPVVSIGGLRVWPQPTYHHHH